MDLTETLKRRERIFDGVMLTLNRDTVALPDGEEKVREWVEHPGAAAVVPLFENGDTLLLRQFRYPPQREFLEVPAGKLDVEGESPAETARRELGEEAGYTARRLTPLGETYPCIGYSDEVIHLFLGEEVEEAPDERKDDELLEPIRLPFVEAVRRARAGEILDAKSVVALLRADAFLAGRGGRG